MRSSKRAPLAIQYYFKEFFYKERGSRIHVVWGRTTLRSALMLSANMHAYFVLSRTVSLSHVQRHRYNKHFRHVYPARAKSRYNGTPNARVSHVRVTCRSHPHSQACNAPIVYLTTHMATAIICLEERIRCVIRLLGLSSLLLRLNAKCHVQLLHRYVSI